MSAVSSSQGRKEGKANRGTATGRSRTPSSAGPSGEDEDGSQDFSDHDQAFDFEAELNHDKDASAYVYATQVTDKTSIGEALRLVRKQMADASELPGSPDLLERLEQATETVAQIYDDHDEEDSDDIQKPTAEQWALVLGMMGAHLPLRILLQLVSDTTKATRPQQEMEDDDEDGLEVEAGQGEEEGEDEVDAGERKSKIEPWKPTKLNMTRAREHLRGPLKGQRKDPVQRPSPRMAQTWDQRGES